MLQMLRLRMYIIKQQRYFKHLRASRLGLSLVMPKTGAQARACCASPPPLTGPKRRSVIPPPFTPVRDTFTRAGSVLFPAAAKPVFHPICADLPLAVAKPRSKLRADLWRKNFFTSRCAYSLVSCYDFPRVHSSRFQVALSEPGDRARLSSEAF